MFITRFINEVFFHRRNENQQLIETIVNGKEIIIEHPQEKVTSLNKQATFNETILQ